MTNNIVRQDVATLLDGWIEAERNGVGFPVPLELAASIAGYSRKDVAKRKLKPSMEGKLFHRKVEKTAGRGSEQISLTTDGLKHLCLLAETEEGENVRQYFIEAEKKWRLVQQVAPKVAEEIEVLHIKLEIAKQEAIAEVARKESQSLRHLVVSTCPEHVQQKILGYQLVEKVEYRDRVIQNNQVLDDGDTINKTALCDRYNIKTRNGSPDFKRLNAFLDGAGLPNNAWEETTTIRSNMQLRREYLGSLDRHVVGTTRQLHVGE
jgi:hypothetical protein